MTAELVQENKNLHELIRLVSIDEFSTYCLGTGCMEKCNICHHDKNWMLLDALNDPVRIVMQAKMARIGESHCQLRSGCHYKEKV